MKGLKESKMIVLLIIVIVIISALSLNGLSLFDDDDDPDTIDITEENSIDTDVLEIFFNSESTRKNATPMVVEDDPYLVLACTPVALWYQGLFMQNTPLIVDSDGPAGDRFLQLYPHEEAVGVGDISNYGGSVTSTITGSREEISTALASEFWQTSDGVILIENTNESYKESLAGVVLASYLNIPVIVYDSLSSTIKETLDDLGVKYSIIFGDSEGYAETIHFKDEGSVENIVLRLLGDRFGGVSYITLTNPNDLELEYALPGMSSLAPFLSASHQGMVCSADIEPITDGKNFREEVDAFEANETTFLIKERLLTSYQRMDQLGLFNWYTENSPYLAIMGSAYSIPFYYTYLVPKGIMADTNPVYQGALPDQPSIAYQEINDPALVPSDDIYSDLDGNFATHELAIGRPIGINLEDASAFIARAMFYDIYMEQWVESSPISQLIGAEWKDSAFIHCGDDWNGYVLISAPAYVEVFEYLNTHGYTTYTTIGTGETVNQVMQNFESSNMVFILAHGSQTGFHMIDGYTAADVKDWWVGPSSFVVTSCNVGNTDCPNLTNIDNSIAFAIMRSGVNAFYGGMRYEYTGVYNTNNEYPLVASGSPRLSQIIIKKLTEQDLTSGMALRNSKIQYMEELDNGFEMDYDVAIKILYGDPMFNPYEPYNNF